MYGVGSGPAFACSLGISSGDPISLFGDYFLEGLVFVTLLPLVFLVVVTGAFLVFSFFLDFSFLFVVLDLPAGFVSCLSVDFGVVFSGGLVLVADLFFASLVRLALVELPGLGSPDLFLVALPVEGVSPNFS